MAIRRAVFHSGQRIVDIGPSQFLHADLVDIVRVNRHQRHALVPVISVQLADPALVELRCQAVIARENDREYLAVRIIAQLVSLAVHPSQRKIRSARADGQNGMRGIGLDLATRDETARDLRGSQDSACGGVESWPPHASRRRGVPRPYKESV